jgi:hypothetical protein
MSSESQINQQESTHQEPTQQEPTQQEPTQQESNQQESNRQENNYNSLGMWFSVGADTPLPLRALLYSINSEKTGNDKLSDEELEHILTFVEMMSEKAPHTNVEITPLVYFIKHLNRTKDITESVEVTQDEVEDEENEDTLEELSEDEEEEVNQEEDKEEEEISDEEEAVEEEDEEEEEEESDTDSQFVYNKDMPTVLISNNRIDIPFPITCTFTVLMMLYSIQLGLLFCRLIGCNYLEHSHDEL